MSKHLRWIAVCLMLAGCAVKPGCKFVSDGQGIGLTCTLTHKIHDNPKARLR